MARNDPRASLKALQRQDPLPAGMARVQITHANCAFEGVVPQAVADMVVAILNNAASVQEEREKPEDPPP